MATRKRLLLAGAAISAIGMATAGTVGLASAATATGNNSGTSIVDKIASKFSLNKSDVQAVFDADRTEHQTEMKANQEKRLAQAVTDGKLTQDQADHIKAAMVEIDTLMAGKSPDQQDDAARQAIKTKMDTLRTWATDNKVDSSYIMGGGHGGPGGHGGRGMKPADDVTSSDDATGDESSSSDTSSSSSSN